MNITHDAWNRFICILILLTIALWVVMKYKVERHAVRSITAVRGVSESNFSHRRNGTCNIIGNFVSTGAAVDLRVILITYDRPQSVLRLLNSLNRANYYEDKVTIDVWIDRSKDGNYSQEIVDLIRSFRFAHGQCNLYIHPIHVGIRGQWTTTWRTKNYASEIAVILEDDLTVSRYFYKYLQLVHQKYGKQQDICGFSLQGMSIRHSDGSCCLNVPSEHKVFRYPTLGTFGFSPNGPKWLNFLAWYRDLHKSSSTGMPLVPGHIASEWYKSFLLKGNEESMWEMEHIYYTWKNKEYILYPNFKVHRGLTFNWLENGLHYHGQTIVDEKTEEANILVQWFPEYDNLPDNPVYVNINGEIEKGYI